MPDAKYIHTYKSNKTELFTSIINSVLPVANSRADSDAKLFSHGVGLFEPVDDRQRAQVRLPLLSL